MTAAEIAWRWVYGFPALWLVAREVRAIFAGATGGTMDPAQLGLDRALLNDPVGALTADPMGVAGKLAHAGGLLLPGLEHVAAWLVPVLVAVWIVVSALGRTVVLRRVDDDFAVRPLTLMVLHAVRTAMLSAVLALWLWGVSASGHVAVSAPVARGEEPNLVLVCGLVIVLSLALFVLWNSVSWVFAFAPVLAMARDEGAWASLREAATLRGLRGKLAEVNLVLGIVKIVLLVLAMTFSATPLPFSSVTTPGFLAWWWAGVGLLYVVWSDFFHVARLVSYLDLWDRFEEG